MNTAEMLRVFGRIGCLSFGGPAAQIALMQKELVDDRPLLSQDDFLKALSFCMMLPGPEAMQLATYAGWKLNGMRGGLIAGGLFILPGALLIAVLAFAYASFGALPLIQAAFLGIKAAVIIIVVQAILKLLGRALERRDHRIIAVLAFLALFLFNLPFPLVIVLAAGYGALTCSDHSTIKTALPWRRSITPIAIGGVLWGLPLLAAWAAGATFLLALGLFFSKLALVTFGGAYAVLAYMTQAVVTDHGWLSTAQMIDALGLAETTPGPLILVTEFVGITAGIAQSGWPLGLLAGVMTLWVTFVPCFIWIFAGAPLIDWLDGYPRIRAGLAAITAAVVGVIANLSVWFAAHVMFDQVDTSTGLLRTLSPDWSSFNVAAFALTALAALLLLKRKLPMIPTLAVMAAAGIAFSAAI
ncbi:chromate efflux transporter [Octadecabacter sp. 1_MG-2023]|uniref:chromate efflux transporter n=1 Tax=unclassified Octadecabacter TaxID=196158 RepID=UPI001C0880AB|nr:MULTISPECIES: chromate efflux transporter [unclassified Octadecabacter]MBU2993538.1 chromate efflux transporter [Octadecabacter sp. B2R22]MDO6735618.1 chromate efflux transporter [Octadecabacter sp. 1_MG-2023]